MDLSLTLLRRNFRNKISLFLIVGVIFVTPLCAIAEKRAEDFKAHMVKTPDGVSVSAQEWGNPTGVEIVLT